METGKNKHTKKFHVNLHDFKTNITTTYFSGTHKECNKFLTTLKRNYSPLWHYAQEYNYPSPCISSDYYAGATIQRVSRDNSIIIGAKNKSQFHHRAGKKFPPGTLVYLLYSGIVEEGWIIASLDLRKLAYYELGEPGSY